MRSLLLGMGLALTALGAQAIEVDAKECREASQFIGNAAQARKNGATREMFVGKLEEDIFLVSAYPPELRWFVHGDEEAQFLRRAVQEVFQFPRDPKDHAASFLADCLRSAGLQPNFADSPKPDQPEEEQPGDWAGNV
jgi:hypothetical protein